MTTSEPTTEEVVRNFRGAHIFGITQALENRIADRLESQEQTIAALTARAEKAEKNRDIWEKKWWEEARKKVEAQVFRDKAERERDAAVAEKERILNLRASENTDNKYLYML
jgi:ClpP class serine protease